MEFVINGVGHSLDASTVRSALRGGAPDPVREHWVDVDGVRWPPKQALGLATGLDRADFTSHRALGLFERLGFTTSPWGNSRQLPGTHKSTIPRLTELSREAPAAARETAAAADAADIVLVGCSGSKASVPTRAADLFTGTAFRKARDLALRSEKPWHVLSAKFGLLDPEEVVAPYDVYLGHQSSRYRTAWGAWVVAQLGQRHDLSGAVVEVHAGRAYTEPLLAPLAAAGATLVEPLAGLRQGERLAWYNGVRQASSAAERSDVALVDVAPLLNERNSLAPADFLAAGRPTFDRPGLYSWWVDVAGAHALSAGLGHPIGPGLVYAGRAGGLRPSGKLSTNTLWGRVGGMHLQGNRNFSTFRLTLTAALRHSGEPVADESSLTRWMHAHMRVAVLPALAAAVFPAEETLLERADPPLNLQGMATTPLRRTLSQLRSAVSTAESPIPQSYGWLPPPAPEGAETVRPVPEAVRRQHHGVIA